MATYEVSNKKRGCSDAQRNKDNSGGRGGSRRGMGKKGTRKDDRYTDGEITRLD